MKHKTLSALIMSAFCLLSPACPMAQEQDSSEIKSLDKWQFSGMKGNTVYFASHANPARGSKMTDEERASFRRAMTDNSSMPVLSQPVVLEDRISNMADATIAWTKDSKVPSEHPCGIAVVKLTDALGENVTQYIVWRGENVTSLVNVGAKITAVYTIHHNVRLSDGGYLLTYTTIRNSALGVSSYAMSGSAKLVK